jgi:DNA-binding MarR family transcriptional regulator
MSKGWTFLSHHAHVLIVLAHNSDETIDNVAASAGITARSVTSILGDLIEAGYITKTKVGRRNHYVINTGGPLRHPTSAHKTVGDLIHALGSLSS